MQIMQNRRINKLSDYGNKNGTSMAAPHVAGVAGLLLALEPTLDYIEIKSTILNTVDRISALSDKTVSGGRLNAKNALCSLNPVAGDLTCDGIVALDDAVLGLQVLAGVDPPLCTACISAGIDVNGDGLISAEEALYVLQKVSGLR